MSNVKCRIFSIFGIFLLCCCILAFAPTAHAAQASTSNVSGSLSVWSETTDWFIVDWNLDFTINSGAVGDTVSISTNNVNMWTPRDVTIGSGEVIGVLELVSSATSYPNSWNIRNEYQIRLTKEVASASVQLAGSTTTSFNRFIASGGHDEPVWINVNGVNAASGSGHMHSCAWADSDTWSCIVGGIPQLHYENGSIAQTDFTGLVHAGDVGAQVQVGDRVVWNLKEHFFHIALKPGVTIGQEFEISPGYTPGNVPHSHYIATDPYGFLEPYNISNWKYKVLWCNEFDCAIEITQVGNNGSEWSFWQPFSFNLSPQNGTTVNFADKKTEPCDYWTGIYRAGSDSPYYQQDTAFDFIINSQEVLSEASFFARVNTSVTNGTITPSVQAEQGANITIEYSPNTGYELESIVVDGAALSLTSYPNSYTFYNTQGTHTIDVRYKIKTFTVTTSVTNGSISPSETVNWGTSKTVSYSPSSGYLLKSVTVDGSAVNISSYPSSYAFSNIQANHSIAVVYAAPTASKAGTPSSVTAETSTNDKITYTISYTNPTPIARTVVISDTIPTNMTANSINNGGTKSGNTITWTQSVAANSSGSVSWVARAEYAAANSTVTNTASVTFKKIAGSSESDVTLNVSKSNTVIRNPTLTTSCTNGTISVGNNNVHRGSNVTVYYSPNSGYLLYDVKIDGSNVNIETYPDSYTFNNYQDDHTVAVSYAAPSASKSWALT